MSETHWNVADVEPNFNPNFFIKIDNEIKNKLTALKFYKSQIKKNSPRSIDAIELLQDLEVKMDVDMQKPLKLLEYLCNNQIKFFKNKIYFEIEAINKYLCT